MLKTIYYPETAAWKDLCRRPVLNTGELDQLMNEIFDQVELFGDIALKNFTKIFEKRETNSFLVPSDEINAAGAGLSDELKQAIADAAVNIRTFHSVFNKGSEVIETTKGVQCWQRKLPIERVGLYIPGGSAPLFSTVLMLAIPAEIAGCEDIILCTPAGPDGKVNEAVLFTANLVGVTKIFALGGAQAIAAMAIGTESIPKVDKIFGPGNQYVTSAKQYAARSYCAIDLPAGPSEVLVIADETADPDFVAADLLSQAEHGEDSQVILLTTSMKMVDNVNKVIIKQLELLPRAAVAAKALQNSLTILLHNLDEAMQFSNLYAPEHLILASDKAEDLALKVKNAGSVFIGHYSPESAGDYASGTNHTLPTNGFARAYSGLTTESFLKSISFQQLSAQGLKNIGNTIELMAEAEQLEAHKYAVSVRLAKLNKP
jgi:histidinol dehydrogenase